MNWDLFPQIAAIRIQLHIGFAAHLYPDSFKIRQRQPEMFDKS